MFKSTIALVFLAGLGMELSLAQGTNARLNGTVTDPSGAAIVDSGITVENMDTGIVLKTRSNGAGVYEFPSLQPGLYRLMAESPGFQKKVFDDLALQVSSQARVDFPLTVAPIAGAVDVNVDLESPLAVTTPSVGSVITRRRLQDLPVAARDALALVDTQPGVINGHLNGARIGTLNGVRDGINIMDQFQNSGVNSVIYESTDIVEELRVVTSPADAELRGSGQYHIYTRSGKNEFHGSVFDSLRNTSLNANNWFNNQRGTPRDSLNRNQFGGRVGGPIFKNRTFFHFLYDAQREVTKNSTTANAYTAQARQGIFRFFPGVQNGNFNANVPTVDLAGNPVRPSTATGDLQSVSVFGRDPNRPAMDPTGTVQRILDLVPLPNNFRIGDGLNTAGYTWNRRATADRDQFNVRIDHWFNASHRLNFSFTHQRNSAINGFAPQTVPDGPGGSLESKGNFYSAQFTSALSPTVLNEFRAGSQRMRNRSFAAYELEGKSYLPVSGGVGFLPNMMAANFANVIPLPGPQGDFTPLTSLGDNLSWTRERHTFKFGGEVRFSSFDGFVETFRVPRAIFGAGGPAVSGIATIPGIGQNQNTAQALLIGLSGSVNNIRQDFYQVGVADPYFFSPQEGQHASGLFYQREFSLFFKDDWKIRRDLTINLGVRYDFFGVPLWQDPFTDEYGQIGIVGGSGGLFGWSGSGWGDLYQPGPQKGPLTQFEFVGPRSPNPDRQIYNDDWNNFAPAVGFSWNLPGLEQTVLRAGYSIGYERFPFFLLGNIGGGEPGVINETNITSSQYLDLARMSLPLSPFGQPEDIVPLTDRTQTAAAYDSNVRTPYVQNWNLSIQRELPGKMSLDVRYVGNKGTKLVRQANLNEVNIFESGVLDAFRVTQAGGNAPLFDQMLNGLTVASALGPVNGSTVTGSQSLRANTNTNAMLANNNVGAFANFLNTTTNFTGIAGELIRRAGLPENLIVASPQFLNAGLLGNFANSTHHAVQIEWNKRSSNGWALQTSYTFAKTLGETPGDGSGFVEGGYRSVRNRQVEKRLLPFHRTHALRANGYFELPMGPGKPFLNSQGGVLARLLERWQFGAVLNAYSGEPIAFTSTVSSLTQSTINTPDLVAPVLKSFGNVNFDSTGVLYFQGLKLIPDPSIAGLTTLQGLNTRSTLTALATQDNTLIAVNPRPGKLGSMYQTYLEGPGTVRFDLNVIKRIRLGETTELEFRADAINVLNRTNFANPDSNINSPTFGRITTTNGGSRLVELHARFNF